MSISNLVLIGAEKWTLFQALSDHEGEGKICILHELDTQGTEENYWYMTNIGRQLQTAHRLQPWQAILAKYFTFVFYHLALSGVLLAFLVHHLPTFLPLALSQIRHGIFTSVDVLLE